MKRKRYLTFGRHHRRREGFALLFSLFIISIVTVMIMNILDTSTLELSALRNSMDYEKALHLANAGIHHAAAMLEADSTWRGTVSEGAHPADDTYSATAVDGTDNFTVQVTSSGAAGSITRTVVASIEL